MPSALFCKSSKTFQSPEWTSSWVLSRSEGGRGEGDGDLLLLSVEAVRYREKCRRGGCSLHPQFPGIAVHHIHSWRSPHPLLERV